MISILSLQFRLLCLSSVSWSILRLTFLFLSLSVRVSFLPLSILAMSMVVMSIFVVVVPAFNFLVMKKTESNRYVYNPAVDLQDVEQFGFVNLNEAFEKGIVPSDAPDSDIEFNGVLNPSTLMHRAQDVFEATRAANYVKDTLALLTDREKKDFEAAQVNVDTPKVSDGEPATE